MSAATHDYTVPPAPPRWSADLQENWHHIPPLSPFVLIDNSHSALYQTITRLCYDDQALYVRFECDDPDIWATMTERDEPIYDEEVAEVFLAAGEDDPTHYFEFEINPNGVLFDAKIVNMGLGHDYIEVHHEWDCPGIQWQAERNDEAQYWVATLIIPWAALVPDGNVPEIWRANFTRIERPRGQEPEFSCWSPTLSASFHEPAQFGILRFAF